jgi:hypothetical protein
LAVLLGHLRNPDDPGRVRSSDGDLRPTARGVQTPRTPRPGDAPKLGGSDKR